MIFNFALRQPTVRVWWGYGTPFVNSFGDGLGGGEWLAIQGWNDGYGKRNGDGITERPFEDLLPQSSDLAQLVVRGFCR